MTDIFLQFKGMDSSKYKVTDESGNDVPIRPATSILQQQGGITSTAIVNLSDVQRVIKLEYRQSKYKWDEGIELKAKQRYLVEYNTAVFEADVLEVATDHLFIKTITASYWLSITQFKDSVIEQLKERPALESQLTDIEKQAVVDGILERVGVKPLIRIPKA